MFKSRKLLFLFCFQVMSEVQILGASLSFCIGDMGGSHVFDAMIRCGSFVIYNVCRCLIEYNIRQIKLPTGVNPLNPKSRVEHDDVFHPTFFVSLTLLLGCFVILFVFTFLYNKFFGKLYLFTVNYYTCDAVIILSVDNGFVFINL